MRRNNGSYCSLSNINEIVFQLDHNEVLSKIKDAKKRFFEVFIIDMLINNSDRNEDNWGAIKFKNTSTYKIAPVYGCGNSFYIKTIELRIKEILRPKYLEKIQN